MREYAAIMQLFDAYQTAKQVFPSPVASAVVEIDGERLVLALMHPAAWKSYEKTAIIDPRTGPLEVGDTPPSAGTDGGGTGQPGSEKSKP